MKRLVAAGLFWSSMCHANAQSLSNDTALTDERKITLENQYQHYMGGEAPLFNGAVYVDYTHTVSGSLPFWNNAREFIKGNIFINQLLYTNVLINYDVYKDKLLIQHPVNDKIFEVQQSDVVYFDLSAHRFVAIGSDKRGLRPGFYELVYDGLKSKVYGRHGKELSQDLSENTTRYSFVSNNVYYVYRQGLSFKITTIKSLLQAYKNDEVKNFIKRNRFNIKKDMPGLLKSVATFYDNL